MATIPPAVASITSRALARSVTRTLRRAAFAVPHLDWLPWLTGTPEAWDDLTTPQFERLWRTRVLQHAHRSTPRGPASLQPLFAHAARRLTFHQRIRALFDTARAVELGRTRQRPGTSAAWRALVPFVLFDPHPEIVGTAAYEIATLLPPTPDDPLRGPRSILFLHVETDRHRGAIAAGLAALGDPRIVDLLRGARQRLGPAGGELLAQASVPFVSEAWVEFLVEWLEETAIEGSREMLQLVAQAIAALARDAGGNGVIAVERTFPGSDYAQPDPRRLVRVRSRREYAERLAPRLLAVAQLTQDLAPLEALRAWGLDRTEPRHQVSRRPTAGSASEHVASTPSA